MFKETIQSSQCRRTDRNHTQFFHASSLLSIISLVVVLDVIIVRLLSV